MDPVTVHESAESRGRIPAHDFGMQLDLTNQLVKQVYKKIKIRHFLIRLGLLYKVIRSLNYCNMYLEISNAIHLHYYSYNKLRQPVP